MEDAGFYCVDNMPVALLPMFLEQPIESVHEIAGFAFVMDLREKGFLSNQKLQDRYIRALEQSQRYIHP